MLNRPEKRRCGRALKKIYKRVPDCHCKGLCVQACGPVPFSATERAKVESLAPHGWIDWENPVGTYIPVSDENSDLICPFLQQGKCSIYDDRPLVCRMYGAAEKLQCEHGCKPTVSVQKEAEIRNEYFRLIQMEGKNGSS